MRITKNGFKGVLCFVAGSIVTLILMQGIFNARAVDASSKCIRTDLDARGSNGDIPNTKFTVGYEFPKCLLDKGYKVVKVWKTTDSKLRVTYAHSG